MNIKGENMNNSEYTILSDNQIQEIQQYVDRYNSATKPNDKCYYFGLVSGMCRWTNYAINYAAVKEQNEYFIIKSPKSKITINNILNITKTLMTEAAQC